MSLKRAVPGPAAGYRNKNYLNRFICLEFLDCCVALVARLFAVDTSKRDASVLEQDFDEVEREGPVRKDDAGKLSAFRYSNRLAKYSYLFSPSGLCCRHSRRAFSFVEASSGFIFGSDFSGRASADSGAHDTSTFGHFDGQEHVRTF
jgi:hypothetical protein